MTVYIFWLHARIITDLSPTRAVPATIKGMTLWKRFMAAFTCWWVMEAICKMCHMRALIQYSGSTMRKFLSFLAAEVKIITN